MEATTLPEQHLNLRSLDDLILVKMAVRGNNTAYTLLFERYYQSLSHFISKHTSNLSDVQDLTMEVFGKAFMKISTYVPGHAFSTWLFTIAHHNCIDYFRKQKLRQRLQLSTGLYPANLSSSAPNPEEQLIQQEGLVWSTKLMNQLDPRYSKMIVLRFLEERSYEEISSELHLPIGTVKAQLFRAKAMMRQLMQTSVGEA